MPLGPLLGVSLWYLTTKFADTPLLTSSLHPEIILLGLQSYKTFPFLPSIVTRGNACSISRCVSLLLGNVSCILTFAASFAENDYILEEKKKKSRFPPIIGRIWYSLLYFCGCPCAGIPKFYCLWNSRRRSNFCYHPWMLVSRYPEVLAVHHRYDSND